MRTLTLLCIILIAPTPALANDASFDEKDTDLAPLRKTRIRMASEDIIITQPAPDADH